MSSILKENHNLSLLTTQKNKNCLSISIRRQLSSTNDKSTYNNLIDNWANIIKFMSPKEIKKLGS